LYGIAGERLLPEFEIHWLAGYESSAPVRVGNAAATQFQLDVYGEVMDTIHVGVRAGLAPSADVWSLQRELVSFVESHWDEPDEGLWEVRGPRQHFTHSRIMAWVTVDRAVKCVERFGLKGPAVKWRAIRDEIRRQVCERGFDSSRGAFVQSFGSKLLDASLLMIPLVGFLPATDPRVIGTVEAIGRELTQDGVIRRYDTGKTNDGLPTGEGAFLACSFWYADNLAMMGRTEEATAMFEGLAAIQNDVGLLAEEYDPVGKRQLGNFPQAFSHVGLINTAQNIANHRGAAQARARH
jgi:GH15 family glucan-1,4-alpha-glucosidase